MVHPDLQVDHRVATDLQVVVQDLQVVHIDHLVAVQGHQVVQDHPEAHQVHLEAVEEDNIVYNQREQVLQLSLIINKKI